MSEQDPTEAARREMVAEINKDPETLEEYRAKYGKAWDTKGMQEEFEPIAFMAPFIMVRRKSDGKKGTLMFQHSPRVYWGFEEA